MLRREYQHPIFDDARDIHRQRRRLTNQQKDRQIQQERARRVQD